MKLTNAQFNELQQIVQQMAIRCQQHRSAQDNHLEQAHVERDAGDALDSRIAILRGLLK